MARRKNRGARADAAAVLAMVRRNASPRLLASIDAEPARFLSLIPPLDGVPTAAEAFSGGGMFSFAMDVEGVEAQHHCENWPPAVKTIRYNVDPSATICDAWDWVPTTPPNGLDILAGGPPCQPWSQAGKRRGEADPRNLWGRIIKWVAASRPRVLLMENVAGIKEAAHADFFAWWWGELAALGYSGTVWSILAADYGTPQRRPRTWFVAWPTGAVWGDALSKPPPARFGNPKSAAVKSGQLPPWVRAFDRLTGGCCGGFGYDSCAHVNNHMGMCGGCKNGSNYEDSPQMLPERELSEAQVNRAMRQWAKHPGWDITGSKTAHTVTGRAVVPYLGATLTKAHGKGVQLPVVYDPGHSLIPPGCPTEEYGGMGELRYLAVGEVSKLMDLPPSFLLKGTEGQKIMQLGNGIAVNMGRAVVQHVLRALGYTTPQPNSDASDPYNGLWSMVRYSACDRGEK